MNKKEKLINRKYRNAIKGYCEGLYDRKDSGRKDDWDRYLYKTDDEEREAFQNVVWKALWRKRVNFWWNFAVYSFFSLLGLGLVAMVVIGIWCLATGFCFWC